MLQSLLTPRRLWLALAAGCAGLVAASLVLTVWQNLHPCHLCIFQRLLYLLLACIGLAAGLLLPRPAAKGVGFLALPLAATGLGVATYQSWLQAQPPGSISCVGGEPGLIERLVEWLGRLQPELFLATGFCEEAELSLLGLSLANWSVLGFAACLALGYLAWRPIPERRLFSN
ncbi:MAG: disulfide bond formation protein B [Hydrogenophilales bacterium CG17_big_fil_post_rev_8_21_14_2_50_63_12]|nr:MAG: disulfide bond formation protein B [Hydrogenophilales bacterium CG17_big_fil_post_rev_8_21_14_2_50_63_12]PIX98028.1 MAG: disulfide bond formation protein B [Hydrogenophilales bacterium CG_4_10_14_3_um_filter_63_21]PJB02692.1 MAG: disulfide bond formation protein B [Hydrogenophilales bacterium CG_4_9_14_3_um_filter_63_34]